MKVLDWSLAQEMIHQKEVGYNRKEKPNHAWYPPEGEDYFCGFAHHRVKKTDARVDGKSGRQFCPVHNKMLRTQRRRRHGEADNRKRVGLIGERKDFLKEGFR